MADRPPFSTAGRNNISKFFVNNLSQSFGEYGMTTQYQEQLSSTSFNEKRTVSKQIQQAPSTTNRPNSRIIVLENGQLLNEDERIAFFNDIGPVYHFSVSPGDEYIIQGRERNAYTPGSDFATRVSSAIDQSIPSGQYVPDGVTIDYGYFDLLNSTRDEEMVLRATPDDVRSVIVNEGSVAEEVSLEAGEWEHDPFEEGGFRLNKFAVKGIRSNLYGAGELQHFVKYRDQDSNEQYVMVATNGNQSDPLVNTYNMFTGTRVQVDADASELDMVIGPFNFFSEVDQVSPLRTKQATYNSVTINNGLNETPSVLKVFRINPNELEGVLSLESIRGFSDVEDGILAVREINPEYLDFPGVDETNDSNWETPPGQRPQESSVQSLQFSTGDVTIQEDGSGIIRGYQRVEEPFFSTGGSGRGSGSVEVQVRGNIGSRISDLFYMTVLGRTTGAPADLPFLKLGFLQRW